MWSVPKAGGPLKELATFMGSAGATAVGGPVLADGAVFRVPKAGGPTQTLLTNQRGVVALGIDDKRVYVMGGTDYHRSLLALAK